MVRSSQSAKGLSQAEVDEKYHILSEVFSKNFPFFAGILSKVEPLMDGTWQANVVHDLEAMFGDFRRPEFREALQGYTEFSIDAMQNQEYLLRHGRYRASKFSDVKRDLLENAEHMLKNYLPGLFISHYLWPHHYRMSARYQKEVLPQVDRRKPSLFVEVGTGSAVYSYLTMAHLKDIRGCGYDISSHSIAFGKGVARAFGFEDRFTFIEKDAFLHPPEEEADYLLSQEVVEHMEDPLTFCRNLYNMLKSDGLAYITAAVTAGHSDHLYLFNHPAEFEEMLVGVGFESIHSVIEASLDTRVPEKTPRIAGYLLAKR